MKIIFGKFILYISVASLIIYLVFFSPVFSKKIFISENASSTMTLEVKGTVEHLPTPKPLKAIYMTAWVAGTPSMREKLINIIDTTEINAVVIDIKDYTGKVSFHTDNKKLEAMGNAENRIPNIKELIERLHDKNIYVIGRISSFQDSFMANTRPDLAVKSRASGKPWQDRKGVKWIDSGSKEMWDYLVLLGKESYALGFDEINFDYVRFPSDGVMKDMAFPFSEGQKKADVINNYFKYLRKEFGTSTSVLSADLFGLTTTSNDDLNIGQVLEDALREMDYVAPMVYPSHYEAGTNGWKEPAEKPYEVIKYAMEGAVKKAENASTSKYKLRPWLQDFSIGHTNYTPEMVRAQIKATYDSGLDSWMLWSPSNVYSVSALQK